MTPKAHDYCTNSVFFWHCAHRWDWRSRSPPIKTSNVDIRPSPEEATYPRNELCSNDPSKNHDALAKTLNVFLVHYKLTENKELQILYHAIVQDDDSTQLAREWWEEAHVSDKYFVYRDEFSSMLTELQSMWDRQLGPKRISIVLN